MNWNKIVLIVSWVALISVIGAAAGYTIYGPHVPLPYIYTSEAHTETEEHLPTNEDGEEETHRAENSSVDHEEPEISTPLTDEPADPTEDLVTSEASLESADHTQVEEEQHASNELEDEHSNAQQPDEYADNETTEHETASTKEQEKPAPTAQSTNTPDHSSDSTSEDVHEPVSDGHNVPEVAALQPTKPIHEDALNTAPSWKRYGQKPPEADGRPKIAIVLTGLGLSRAATEAAIRQLPKTITLSFTPYARDLESWIALARSHHHEVLLDLPMEPLTYPSDDPGPQALLTGRQPEGNINNLAWIANRGSGFVGMTAYMGDRFVTSARQMKPVMEYFKDHGLLFLDNGKNKESLAVSLGAEYGVPVVVNQRAVDEAQLSRGAIDSRLAQVERIALKNGFAIATGRPYPVTLERIATWIHDIESKGFQLVPLTAVAAAPGSPDQQPDAHATTTTTTNHDTEAKADEGENSGHE
ncbi:divergent polysaccharide deacetylase family protein [Kiloniella sp.]|uniref:divergent polysaccharide deacetylase family protein n=1 Tax=Kiloniella sp. TaxID=1938587 RepID=UPI003B0108AC